MSDPWGDPWSNNPNAPQIPFWVYTAEREGFVGRLAGAILYGTQVHVSLRLYLPCPFDLSF